MTVTFCGHGNVFYDEDIKQLLYNELDKLIISGENRFYLGGYGNFDTLVAETLRKLKVNCTILCRQHKMVQFKKADSFIK